MGVSEAITMDTVSADSGIYTAGGDFSTAVRTNWRDAVRRSVERQFHKLWEQHAEARMLDRGRVVEMVIRDMDGREIAYTMSADHTADLGSFLDKLFVGNDEGNQNPVSWDNFSAAEIRLPLQGEEQNDERPYDVIKVERGRSVIHVSGPGLLPARTEVSTTRGECNPCNA